MELGHEAVMCKLMYGIDCGYAESRTDGDTARLVSYPESTDQMLGALVFELMSLGDSML